MTFQEISYNITILEDIRWFQPITAKRYFKIYFIREDTSHFISCLFQTSMENDITIL